MDGGWVVWDSATEHQTAKPTPRAGQANGNLNALKHGGRAKATLVLPDEHQEDYDQLADMWREEFVPDTPVSNRLVDKLILNEWLRERAERNLLQAEEAAREAGANPMQWPDHVVQRLHLMQRYKTTAERAARLAYAAIRQLVQDNLQAIENYERTRLRVKEARIQKELGRTGEERVIEPKKEVVGDESTPVLGTGVDTSSCEPDLFQPPANQQPTFGRGALRTQEVEWEHMAGDERVDVLLEEEGQHEKAMDEKARSEQGEREPEKKE